jgi:hypothetical protein
MTLEIYDDHDEPVLEIILAKDKSIEKIIAWVPAFEDWLDLTYIVTNDKDLMKIIGRKTENA